MARAPRQTRVTATKGLLALTVAVQVHPRELLCFHCYCSVVIVRTALAIADEAATTLSRCSLDTAITTAVVVRSRPNYRYVLRTIIDCH